MATISSLRSLSSTNWSRCGLVANYLHAIVIVSRRPRALIMTGHYSCVSLLCIWATLALWLIWIVWATIVILLTASCLLICFSMKFRLLRHRFNVFHKLPYMTLEEVFIVHLQVISSHRWSSWFENLHPYWLFRLTIFLLVVLDIGLLLVQRLLLLFILVLNGEWFDL